MGVSTLSVGLAVTPTVIETWITHYLNRKPRHQKPTAHISYDVGLGLIRRFLLFAASNSVEDIQAFTSQWVPSPRWVRTEDILVAPNFLSIAASHLVSQLGPEGLRAVGGQNWWQWRRDGTPLKAEWIEMRKDHDLRRKRNEPCRRSMLYVHGGAYYFGSVEEHRYQMQRHARKLQARVLAPRYRLSPQYPFPCGLQDCLAAYLYLLTQQGPESIVLAGDSAGGGMVVSLLVVLRDQGLPLPAGAILLSPWVDLTHSFPSVAGYNALDYVPPMGFHHKPSMTWPPPDSDEQAELDHVKVDGADGQKVTLEQLKHEEAARQGKKRATSEAPNLNGVQLGDEAVQNAPLANGKNSAHTNNLTLELDGKTVEIKDQIQMYATNALISHPLVSPVLQASLGGLPPLCILVGGGEMLRDEQIYLAHKAAHPEAYPSRLATDQQTRRYPPTDVQLQVWDDLCHVAPTLSFTRPAKYMFRSVAQFGAWALARAQKSEIRILDDDEVSNISDDSNYESDESEDEEEEPRDALASHKKPETDSAGEAKPELEAQRSHSQPRKRKPYGPRVMDPNSSATSLSVSVGRAGDPIPPFRHHMIRQRCTRHGDIFPLPPPASLPACQMSAAEVGIIKEGPVRKWLAAQTHDAERFAAVRTRIQKKRLRQATESTKSLRGVFADEGQLPESADLANELPPPTAWAGMRKEHLPPWVPGWKVRGKKSQGLGIWTGWGSKHDEEAIENEEEKVKNKEDVTMSITQVRNKSTTADAALQTGGMASTSKDVPAGQSETARSATTPDSPGIGSSSAVYGTTPAPALIDLQRKSLEARNAPLSDVLATHATIAEGSKTRAAIAGQAVPFKVARPLDTVSINPSIITLNEAEGALDPHTRKPSQPGNLTPSRETARASSKYGGIDVVDGAPLTGPESSASAGGPDESGAWAHSTVTSMKEAEKSSVDDDLLGARSDMGSRLEGSIANSDNPSRVGTSHGEEAVVGQAQAVRVVSGQLSGVSASSGAASAATPARPAQPERFVTASEMGG